MDDCRLRKACRDDADMVFDWANDPVCRQNSFSNAKIEYSEHIAWFDRTIADPDCLFYIFCCNGFPCGQARINKRGGEGVISFSLAKEYRGKGLGKVILQLLEQAAIGESDLHLLIGYVKEDNAASVKSFLVRGFSQSSSEKCFVFSKKIRA